MIANRVMIGHNALNAICEALGIDEPKLMQKMVIEIEAGSVVKLYTRSLVPQSNLLAFVKLVKDMTVTDACEVIVHEEKQ